MKGYRTSESMRAEDRYGREAIARQARTAALHQLKKAHPEVWEEIYDEERAREGLTEPARPRRSFLADPSVIDPLRTQG
jgi:hypothetical protein